MPNEFPGPAFGFIDHFFGYFYSLFGTIFTRNKGKPHSNKGKSGSTVPRMDDKSKEPPLCLIKPRAFLMFEDATPLMKTL